MPMLYLIISAFVVSCFITWFNIRFEAVKDFRNNLMLMALAWDKLHAREITNLYNKSAFEWMFKCLPSFTRMLFSNKPLKEEDWLNNYQYKKLFGKPKPGAQEITEGTLVAW